MSRAINLAAMLPVWPPGTYFKLQKPFQLCLSLALNQKLPGFLGMSAMLHRV